MVELVLFVLVIVLFIYARETRSALRGFQAEIDEIRSAAWQQEESGLARAAEPSAETDEALHRADIAGERREIETLPPPDITPQPERFEDAVEEAWPDAASPLTDEAEVGFGARFEQLVGGKLPIWIGAAALVFAAVFLVRYSIELGLLGPRTRSIIAALFGLTMVGLAVFGSWLPRIGVMFSSDRRIGQALAGAGVATLYATLYMAAELYGLIGLASSFILVVAVTIMAMALAIRHGPPTAIFGLIGGFAAPWIANLGPDSLPLLSLYLAILIAGLFGMAVWMRWLWLVAGAVGFGLLWIAVLIVWDANAGPAFIGLLILGIGLGGALAANRILAHQDALSPLAEIRRLAGPTILGAVLLELAMLVASISFAPLGWIFYAVLSVAVILLARRDPTLTPVVGGALALALIVLASAVVDTDIDDPVTIAAAFGVAAVFGIGGLVHALGRKDSPIWAMVGLAAPVLTAMIYQLQSVSRIGDVPMGAMALAAFVPAAMLAWQADRNLRREAPPQGAGFALTWATGICLILAAMVIYNWVVAGWAETAWIALLLPVLLWCRHAGGATDQSGKQQAETGARSAMSPRNRGGQIVALGLVMLIALISTGFILFPIMFPFGMIAAGSFFGETLHYGTLPPLMDGLRSIALPAAILTGLGVWFGTGLDWRNRITLTTLAIVTGGAALYLVAKQPLVIDTPEGFTMTGFVERAIITQILAAVSWACFARGAFGPGSPWTAIGWVFAGVALFRLIWFDLLLLNPVFLAQQIGPAPIANAGTIHFALGAIWIWLISRIAPSSPVADPAIPTMRLAALAMMALAVLISVRQIVHGSIVAGQPVSEIETYLYSAALLGLSIIWLWRGLSSAGDMFMRLAGLTLLTVVTLKVFLIDAAAVQGILRIVSFLALGMALIGIGWFFGKLRRVNV